jgi:UDP-2-acetamido-2,6-beta-L-arabino-hexul-4-ose reductase
MEQTMNILVTGAHGFIGRNLIAELKNRGYKDVFEYDIGIDPKLLDEYCSKSNFVYHIAGINRPKDQSEYMEGNFGFTSTLLDTLKKHNNTCPVLISSSIQAEIDNPYGKSKKAAEKLLFDYGEETGARVFVYRLPNVFGKWCRPYYNSVVTTWCHDIARGLPIQINNPGIELNLVYIDDVVDQFINALKVSVQKGADGFAFVPRSFKIKLGQLADMLYSFKESRKSLVVPNFESDFERFLYATYISYLPHDDFGYSLEMKHDNRGWLAEFIKSKQFGQIFVSRTKPGITRGNHWHHTKIEKFLVIDGEAAIKFRKFNTDEVIEYNVSGEKLQVLDIPAGYTHSITNAGQTDVLTLFWTDEIFNTDKPDTYYLEV